MKVLITGAPGFIGSNLLLRLQRNGAADPLAPALELTDPASIRRALEAEACSGLDAVIHLAGISHVPTCERDPEHCLKVNRDGTAALAEVLAELHPRAHFIFASTAQVYQRPGERENQVIITESRAIEPQNTYAATKWAAEQELHRVSREKGLRVTILRLFNHTHKSQSPDFFLPHIHRELVAARDAGRPARIQVGNIDLVRDLGAIQDLLAALEVVLRAPVLAGVQVFNVCSGHGKNLRTLAMRLGARLGVEAQFEVDPARVRKNEPALIVGSHDQLTAAHGWKPDCVSEEALVEAFLRDY